MKKKILIIADIEGSTGCGSYNASSFNTPSWYDACIDMSLDINAVVSRLFESGAEKIYIKDFHRTGYNLLPELIDSRASIIHGYRKGPVPGIGDVYDADTVMFIGMHASSGSRGFLAHTLTSRFSSILADGRRVSELQLFASSLYNYKLKPVFFSGCPVACREASDDIPEISIFRVEKDKSGFINKVQCREKLALAAADSLKNKKSAPYLMKGSFIIELKMRDGSDAAAKISKRWNLHSSGDSIFFKASDFNDFYMRLIRVTYFTPVTEKITHIALCLFNLYGRSGLSIVRWRKNKDIRKVGVIS